jgi:archaea-specific DNA-binding protein
MSDQNIKKDFEKGVIFVGNKPLMKYVTAVIMQFNSENLKKVKIKSRGKFISKAIDVEEIVRKRFLKEKNIKISDIQIDSEEFENKEGRKINVSTLTIFLECQ